MTTAKLQTEHIFEIKDGYEKITPKMREDIVSMINKRMSKKDNIVQLDEFPNLYLVRVHKHGTEIFKEEKKGWVTNFGFVTLKTVTLPEKSIAFGIWERIHSSQVLCLNSPQKK